ncbi:Aste57867_21987 [Aphanomyces stellatus]|uniref:Aste57867_21987 protein n=1 Tax=Aphanomyces stellatus TaxID=120398 RepID=A0A485LJ16_9STRA|nr:hypothetical protein As57867_021918 [Aphanomyces stellatus]VFT98655.1 Aste57867_21987 [Aphanomyces stellatus]
MVMKFSEADGAAVAALRKRLLEVYSEEQLEILGMCHPGRLDATLYRYLVARDFDQDEAFKMLQKSVQWRMDIDMPTLMSGPALASNEKILATRRYNPQGFHKRDKDGHHVYVERIGYMDVPTLLSICTEDDIVRTHTQMVEYQFHVLALEDETETTLPKITIIYDLVNIGFNTFSTEMFSAIQQISALNQDHYPETLHKVYIVNAPFFFYAIHKLIEVFLPDAIRNKINFVGSLDELQDAVDADSLPTFLGGTCACVPGQEHGGCITSTEFPTTPFYNGLDAYFAEEAKKAAQSSRNIP